MDRLLERLPAFERHGRVLRWWHGAPAHHRWWLHECQDIDAGGQLLYSNGMDTAEDLQDAELRAWDWRAELKEQGRNIPWLARMTGRPQNSVYSYAYGTSSRPSIEWLREVARVLGKEVPDDPK
jgi:hypothetical protein